MLAATPPGSLSSCSDLRDAAVGIMPHDHASRIAGQPLGRFRGNACAAVYDRLSGRVRVLQDARVDVDDDLIPLGGRTRVDAVVQGGLRE